MTSIATPLAAGRRAASAYTLPPLKFGYGDLSPIIDEKTLRLHHSLHHQAHIDALNSVLQPYPEWQGMTIEDLLRSLNDVPEAIRADVRNFGGGVANHQFFWKILSPWTSKEPSGDLAQALRRDFGSVDAFRREFEAAGLRHFGSGWVFLVANPAADFKLEVVALPNEDSVLNIGRMGLLTCDLWEHAYCLNYQSRRQAWLHAWWQIVDWETVALRFDKFRAGHRQA